MSDSSQKIAVVTGANGFVGSHMCEVLLDQGWHVRAIVRQSSQTRWIDGLDLELLRIGLEDEDLLTEAFDGSHAVFHIAGVIKAKDEKAFIAGNVGLSKRVLNAAQACKATPRVIITSSLAAGSPSPLGQPINESSPSAPVESYGRSKLRLEEAISRYFGIVPVTIIRPPAVYGERDTEILTYFKTVNAGIIPLLGFGRKEVSMVYVRDLCHGMLAAAQSPKAVDQTYYLADPNIHSWKDLGKLTARLLDKQAFTIRVPHTLLYLVGMINEGVAFIFGNLPQLNLEKAGQITRKAWTCSSAKATRDFGFQEYTPIRDGLQKTLAWYRQHNWLK